jgi:hypothetical protein
MRFSLKFQNLIKIPGKSFEDLSYGELASMIEADSSLSPIGNEKFDSGALDVFLHNVEISRPDLLQIRNELLGGIYLDVQGSRIKKVDTRFLLDYASKLRSREGG